MAKLIIEAKGEQARAVALEADTVRIGSAEGNDIRIKSPEVSRQHCEIRRSGMIYRLVDLESKNGTKVNGAFVNQHPLEEGDAIELGPLTLRFVREGPQNGVAVAPRPAGASRPARPRPRRTGGPRRPSAAPVAVLCVLVGLALVTVAVLALRNREEETPNQKILRTMRELAERTDQAAWREALDEASKADTRDGDRETLAAIQQLEETFRSRLYGPPAPPADELVRERMRRLRERVERGLEEHRQDQAGLEALLAEVDEMLDAEGHRVVREVGRLRSARQELLDAIEYVKGDIPNRYRTAQAKVDELVAEDRYGEAIDAWRTFLNENYERMTDEERQEFKQRVSMRETELEKQASQAYRDAEDKAGNYIARGMPAYAVGVYEKVIERFGMSVFEEKAKAAIERIKKP
jgi:hypothetical protein